MVVGGGAAGFFAACTCAVHYAGVAVSLYEKTGKLLSKVKISGGGRCNVTHACFKPAELATNYPRGGKPLKAAFGRFATKDTVDWFGRRGVHLKTETDGRMFPKTDKSQTIADCLLGEAGQRGVQVKLNHSVTALQPVEGGGFRVLVKGMEPEFFDRVIVTTGGSPKPEGLQWLGSLGHAIEEPVPSLFTFNMPGNPVRELMGVAVPQAKVKIAGTKLEATGPVLVTHWGMSGPAVLRLSAWGARLLHQRHYQFTALLHWVPGHNEEEIRQVLQDLRQQHPKRQCGNKNPFALPARLWDFLLQKAGITTKKTWQETGKKDLNRLVNTLAADEYPVSGKTTFKEEFVTCGGISLKSVDMKTMQSRVVPGLFFAGEVLDIDGITGGFNFQAAWTTGYIAGMAAGNELK